MAFDTVTLQNANGMQARFTDYGATLMSLQVRDRNGMPREVVLGFDRPEAYTDALYLEENPYLGAVVGRNANVIANACFVLGGKEHRLKANFGTHQLHGGIAGFDKKRWTIEQSGTSSVVFGYFSPDGEEGFPGNLHVQVSYRLSEENELSMQYRAYSDQRTIVNLTNHSYFNLSGRGHSDILSHELWLDARRYVEFNAELAATGQIKETAGTPLDFGEFRTIGGRIDEPFDQLQNGQGYDVTYVLRQPRDPGQPAARLLCPQSGIQMELFTTLPGLHLYTANTLSSRAGPGCYPRAGVCLEAQYFPDAVHFPHFAAGLLEAGQTMSHTTRYVFSIR